MSRKANARGWLPILLLLASPALLWGLYKSVSIQMPADSYQGFVDNLARKDYGTAEADINKAIRLSPDNALFHASNGLLYFRLVQTPFRLKQLFGEEINLYPEDLNHIESAIQSYKKAILISPNDEGYYHNIGWLYFFSKDQQHSIEYLRNAIALDSTQPMLHVSLGLIQERYGEKESAYQEYAYAVRLSPGIVESPFFSDLKIRMPDQADRIVSSVILDLENKLKQDRSPLLKAKLGKLYLYKKSLEPAEKFLRESAEEMPGLSRPWLNLGQIFEMQYNEDEMKRCYEIADYLDSSDSLPAIRLGDFYDRHNQIPQAVFYYRKGVDRWVEQSSPHTRQTLRLYKAKVVVSNDIIPEELLYYCNPTFDIAGACLKLSVFYRHNGNEKLAEHYDGIGKKFSP